MYRSFYCRGFRVLFSDCGFSPRNSPVNPGCSSPFHFASTVRYLSKCPTQGKQFTISYLMKSCGLSAESAQSVSKWIDFKNPNRPDSVLSLLKNDYGFTISHISKLVKKAPQVLLRHPSRILLPKLLFLSSIGVSSSELPEIVISNPSLLRCSLNGKLIPNYNMLQSVLGSERKVIQSLKCSLFATRLHKNMPPNIAFLRKLGVSQQYVSFLLVTSPEVLCCDGIKFSGIVNRVIELGIDPCATVFGRGVQVISKFNEQAWEKKMTAYRSWGLSEEEILSAFRKHPSCMTKSVKKISGVMDLIVNKMKMGYKAADVICCPSVFDYSLEKRIVPRLRVIRVLQLKGLLKANMPLTTVITTHEKLFLKIYVTKYEAKIPQLQSVYQGKVSIQELGYNVDAYEGLTRQHGTFLTVGNGTWKRK